MEKQETTLRNGIYKLSPFYEPDERQRDGCWHSGQKDFLPRSLVIVRRLVSLARGVYEVA
jgi:hypothetical protein